MERLTKKQALYETVALWVWLAENPEKWKSDWPGWTVENKWFLDRHGGCFACAYSFQENGTFDCDECIIPILRENGGCTNGNEFDRWSEATTEEDRKKSAWLIAESAKEAMEDEKNVD